MMKLKLINYRLSTISRSFGILYALPQDKINAFLNLYIIYDHDWENEDELIRNMGIDYYRVTSI